MVATMCHNISSRETVDFGTDIVRWLGLQSFFCETRRGGDRMRHTERTGVRDPLRKGMGVMDYTVRAVGLAMINHRSGTGSEKPFTNTTRWIDHGVSFVALGGGYARTTRAAV